MRLRGSLPLLLLVAVSPPAHADLRATLSR
jgi:hypothetical protein